MEKSQIGTKIDIATKEKDEDLLGHFSNYLQLEKKYSLHTVTAYLKDLKDFREFLVGAFGMDDILDINYPMIRSWIVFLVDGGISNRTVNRKISSLNSFYRFLLRTKQISENPLAMHTTLKTSKKVQIPFSENEIEGVLDLLGTDCSYEGKRDRLMVELFYSSGIRRAELMNIKLNDFSEAQKLIKIRGKGNKERFVPLLPGVVNSLTSYLEIRGQLEKIVDCDYLFLTSKGVKIYENLVYRVINFYFSRISEKTKKSPHILRHSFATHLLNEGADINSVKELLGHASLASTQVYAQNSIARLKEVYRKSHPRN